MSTLLMPDEYDGGYGAGRVHRETKDITLIELGKAIKRGDNIVLPIIGREISDVTSILTSLRANDYEAAYLILNELDAEKAAKRAAFRTLTTGRYVDLDYILGQGDSPVNTFKALVQEGSFDGYQWFNNDVKFGEKPRLEFEQFRDNNAKSRVLLGAGATSEGGRAEVLEGVLGGEQSREGSGGEENSGTQGIAPDKGASSLTWEDQLAPESDDGDREYLVINSSWSDILREVGAQPQGKNPRARDIGHLTSGTSTASTTSQGRSTSGQDATLHAVAPQFREAVGAWRRFGRKMQKYIVSGTVGIERFSGRAQSKLSSGAVTAADVAQGVRVAEGIAQYILNDRLADINGTTIGNSFAALFKDIPDALWSEYQLYTLARHSEARMSLEERGYGKNKPVLGHDDILDPDGNPAPYTASESAALAAQIETAHPEFVRIFENQKTWWRNFMQSWAVDGGLMGEYLFDELAAKYPDYVPTHRVDGHGVGGPGAVTHGGVMLPSAIRAAKGSTDNVNDIRTSMADLVSRYVRMERVNELVQNMYNFAEAHAEAAAEDVAIIDNDTGVPTDVDFLSFDELALASAAEVKNGRYIIRGWRDGERIAMAVNKDIYDGFNYLLRPYDVSLDAEAIQEVTNFFRKITAPMKAVYTGYNPYFGIRNFVRDAGTYWTNTDSNVVDTFANIGRAVKERAENSGLWQSYQAMGGKASGFISSQQIGRYDASAEGKIKRFAEGAKEVAGFIGGYTENLFRFAEYIEGIRKFGDTPEGRRKAAQMAADVTVNFSRSAPITKAVDSACIFLNANVQGIDKLARRITKNPVKTIARGLSAAGIWLLLRALFRHDENPHYQNLTEHVKDNYYLVPNVFGRRDENGYPTTFIKLPKDRQMGVALIATIERFARWSEGEPPESAFADLGGDVLNSFAINPSPFWAALRAIETNKNYYGGDIVPMYMLDEAAPDQRTAQTSVISEALSERLHDMGVEVSPMTLDYLITQYGGNFYGQALVSMTASDSSGVGRTLANMAEDMLVADPLYSSGVVGRFYDAADEAQYLARKVQRTREQSGIDSLKTVDERGYEELQKYKKEIAKLRKQEREILASEPDTPARKSKIDAIRTAINEVAGEGIKAWENRD